MTVRQHGNRHRYTSTDAAADAGSRRSVSITAGLSPLEIPLRDKLGNVRARALVDQADVQLAYQPWHLNKGYARGFVREGDRWKPRYMHRLILEVRADQSIDHINGDKLDNRRENLRVANTSENAQNLYSPRGTHSRYRGVTWDRCRKRWIARAMLNGVEHNLGRFVSEDEAGAAAAEWRRLHMPFSAEARDA